MLRNDMAVNGLKYTLKKFWYKWTNMISLCVETKKWWWHKSLKIWESLKSLCKILKHQRREWTWGMEVCWDIPYALSICSRYLKLSYKYEVLYIGRLREGGGVTKHHQSWDQEKGFNMMLINNSVLYKEMYPYPNIF